MRSEPAYFLRYQDLQSYVGWTSDDARRIAQAAPLAVLHFDELIADFYREILRHPGAAGVLRGGQAQIDRLKVTLRQWLVELFAGPYDEAYVDRRWHVGLRHVEIGLPQVYTAAAMARLRNGLIHGLRADWRGDSERSADQLEATLLSLNKLIDLDLAIISDAYETEYVHRQREAERQRLDDVLQQEKELSEGLLMHAHAAVLVLGPDGRIVRSNPIADSFAVPKDVQNLEGRDWIEVFLKADDRERVRASLFDQPATAEPHAVIASSLVAARDGERHVYWSAVPLADARGNRFAVLVLGHDVTDLYQAQQRALQAQRLAAIGQMATGLAHESRSALQRIGASAEMLELELEGQPASLALVLRIQQAQSQLHQLLEEVRNYAAPLVLDRSPLRISEAWREAWELLSPQRSGRVACLREHIEPENLVLDADRFRLVQVFRNLLENCLAAASDPVLVDIRCQSAELSGQRALRICVGDNGRGLSPQERLRIFEPFYTTKPTGTGLGTAIAQRLVEAHGGKLEVGETSPAGTEMVLTLPAPR